MDGWEDDVDLLEIDSTTNEMNDNGGGEWSFDEDAILDSEAEEQEINNNAAPANNVDVLLKKESLQNTRMSDAHQAEEQQEEEEDDDEAEEDGGDWSFHDDEILAEDDETPNQKAPSEKPPPASILDGMVNDTDKKEQVQSQQPRPSATHFLDRLANKDDTTTHAPLPNQTTNSITAPTMQPSNNNDEWSFDDDSFLDDEPPPQDDPLLQKQENMFSNLVRYITSLPTLVPSLNALLEAEYNTYHHAVELTEYYSSRPQLYDYTLDTELPRMDYEVVLPNTTTRLTDKYKVQQYLLSQSRETILIRSANQSLLADLLSQLTGEDRLIQHQFLATAVASQCRFCIHASFVECNVDLQLSLPSATGDRLDVAMVQISITFGQPPSICYRLDSVELLVQDLECLRETAAFLSSLDEDSFLEEEHTLQNDDLIRDAFMAKLEQTQQFAKDSHAGLSSAWKQIDAVANVSNKVKFLKQGLTTTLPTTTTTTTAMESEANTTAARASHLAPTVEAVSQPIRGNQPKPPPPSSNATRAPPPPPPVPPRDRPAPILGGLIRSGLNRLAQTVTLPDDEELPPPSTTIPKLYRQEVKTNAPSHSQPAPAPPYPPNAMNAGGDKQEEMAQPSLPVEDAMEDGWGDDDDLDLDDGTDVDVIAAKQSKPPPPPPPPKHPSLPQPTPPAAAAPPMPQQPASVPRPPPPAAPLRPTLEVDTPPAPVQYNPEDDIIPTRKRWVNPRPGIRQLRV